MSVVCDRCGSSTSPKKITSKKTGKEYTVYECQGSCMNGQYKYSCFAPKVAKSAPAQAPAQDNTALLEEIKSIVLLINSKLGMQEQSKVVNKKLPTVDVDDDGIPFPGEEEAPF